MKNDQTRLHNLKSKAAADGSVDARCETPSRQLPVRKSDLLGFKSAFIALFSPLLFWPQSEGTSCERQAR